MSRNSCLSCGSIISSPKFCNNTCQQHYVFEHITLPKLLAGQIRERQTIKRWLLKVEGHKCSCCKLTTWMDQPIPLELDHTDGDAGNNAPSNLRLLCPNCHALTPTWKNRNKGNGRAARGIKLN